MSSAVGCSLLTTVLLVAACNSSSTNDGKLTICRDLPVIDASTSTCSVNLALLSCTEPEDAGNQVTEICLSDNINACPDSTTIGGCSDLCEPGEYAAGCGGPPSSDASAPSAAPPSPSCRIAATTPAGVVFYCCPCGS